jgi:hypothetical protein
MNSVFNVPSLPFDSHLDVKESFGSKKDYLFFGLNEE